MRPGTSRLLQTIFLWLVLFHGVKAWTQENTIRAIVVDSIDNSPLEKCTVICRQKDSTTARTAADNKGFFSLRTKSDTVLLILQHTGYAERRLQILFSKANASDTIRLTPLVREMENIVVKSRLPPIVVRNDTTEYNIDSSMFESYDVVADLLKRLPGLEIDADGHLWFHGKRINRILVDGEDFFGGDPDFSLKKIPAGMVSKIQVMDTKSLEQIFNHLQSDGEEKTLNIKLKPGLKTFGSAEVMAGTRDQLGINGSINSFKNSQRLSLTGSVNSSNKMGLTEAGNGPSSLSKSAGLNYGDKWGKFQFNGSYTYAVNNSAGQSYRERTQFITADSSFFTAAQNRSQLESQAHRFNASISGMLDSTMVLTFNFSYAKASNENRSYHQSTTTENNQMKNESMGTYASGSRSDNFSGNLFLAKRWGARGRSLTVNFRKTTLQQTSKATNTSFNTFFKSNQPDYGDSLNQQILGNNGQVGYALSFSYMEPFTPALRLQVRSEANFTTSETDRNNYNLDPVTYKAQFDSLYSSNMTSVANTQAVSASLIYSKNKLDLNTGWSTTFYQNGRNMYEKGNINQRQLRYAPSVMATLRLKEQKRLQLNFTGATLQPTIEQLQPVPDNSNPLYIRLGNPDLRTAFSQNYTLIYMAGREGKNFSANAGYAPVINSIVNAVYYDNYRRQTSQYKNVSGIYSLRGGLSFSRFIRKKELVHQVFINASGNYGQRVFFQNNSQFLAKNYTVRADLSFSRREQVVRGKSFTADISSSYNREWTPLNSTGVNTKGLTIVPRIEINYPIFKSLYGSASYQLYINQQNYNAVMKSNGQYLQHFINNSLLLQAGKRYTLQSMLVYQYNTQVPESFNRGTINWNLNASVQLFKNKRGLVKLAAYDLLKKYTNLSRMVGENYIEETQSSNLRNYFTLQFQYSLSRLDNKKEIKKTKVSR